MSTTLQGVAYFTIFNLNALDQSSNMVLDVASNRSLVLNPYDTTGKTLTQIWQVVPNLAVNSNCLGFTLCNVSNGNCAWNPGSEGAQVLLNDDPTPWGDSSYCWTMFGVQSYNDPNTGLQTEILTIQDFQRGLCMNATGGQITSGTQIIMYPWGNGTPNAQWVLKQVDYSPANTPTK